MPRPYGTSEAKPVAPKKKAVKKSTGGRPKGTSENCGKNCPAKKKKKLVDKDTGKVIPKKKKKKLVIREEPKRPVPKPRPKKVKPVPKPRIVGNIKSADDIMALDHVSTPVGDIFRGGTGQYGTAQEDGYYLRPDINEEYDGSDMGRSSSIIRQLFYTHAGFEPDSDEHAYNYQQKKDDYGPERFDEDDVRRFDEDDIGKYINVSKLKGKKGLLGKTSKKFQKSYTLDEFTDLDFIKEKATQEQFRTFKNRFNEFLKSPMAKQAKSRSDLLMKFAKTYKKYKPEAVRRPKKTRGYKTTYNRM